MDSGYGWLAYNPLGPTLPGRLAERGYDVWIGNSRGTKYSNKNRKDDEEGWTLKQHWDFDWADMGTYDLPAFVERIREVTGKPKVTLLGYSQGGALIYYALAKNQDWYAERVHRFVSLAGCPYGIITGSYEQNVSQYLK